jgi:hypothetical protein
MKSKQMANVLIKIIGLYVCLCAIPSLIACILAVFAGPLSLTWPQRIFSLQGYAIGGVVQGIAGLILIFNSRKLSEFWFKNENE